MISKNIVPLHPLSNKKQKINVNNPIQNPIQNPRPIIPILPLSKINYPTPTPYPTPK